MPSPLSAQLEAVLTGVSKLVAEHSSTVSAPLGPVTATFLFILVSLGLYLPLS